MIILDSNVLSALILPDPDATIVAWLDRQSPISLWTTSITVMEIRYGLVIMPLGRRRSMRLTALDRVIQDDLKNRVLPFDHVAAEEAATLMEVRHRAGRPRDARDSMIAGIALANRATLATRNVRHFDDLSVPVLDPWQA